MFSRTQRQHFQSGHMGLKLENQDSTLASGSPGLAAFSGFAHVSVFQNGFLDPSKFDRSDHPNPCSPGLPDALFLPLCVFILLLFLCRGALGGGGGVHEAEVTT